MFARSSARALAWRSVTRSRASPSHHGPNTTTRDPTTSTTPTSRTSEDLSGRSITSTALPPMSSTAADEEAEEQRPPGSHVVDVDREERLHEVAERAPLLLGGVAPDEDEPRPPRNNGHASEVSHPTPSFEPTTSVATSAGRNVAARAMPRGSARAATAMGSDSPSKGTSSQMRT